MAQDGAATGIAERSFVLKPMAQEMAQRRRMAQSPVPAFSARTRAAYKPESVPSCAIRHSDVPFLRFCLTFEGILHERT